jgi:hypothetical protein
MVTVMLKQKLNLIVLPGQQLSSFVSQNCWDTSHLEMTRESDTGRFDGAKEDVLKRKYSGDLKSGPFGNPNDFWVRISNGSDFEPWFGFRTGQVG